MIVVSYISFICQSAQPNGDTYAWGTIGTYLSAVASHHTMAGLPNPTITPRVRRAKFAAKKFCKNNGRVRRKWPLSGREIRKWKNSISVWTWNLKVFLAFALLAFCGMHRVSELAFTTGVYKGLKKGNVMFAPVTEYIDGCPAWCTVNLEHSKTDTTWRYGGKAKYFQSKSDLCVVRALWSILEHDTRPVSAPLFVIFNGRNVLIPLARRHVSKFVKEMAALSGLPVSMFDTHSFRAGGACALWAAGYTTDTIRILGRWASDCWMIYVTQADSRIQRLTTDMLNAVTDSVFYARIHDLLRVDPFEAQPLGV
jgi:hypothetical protein